MSWFLGGILFLIVGYFTYGKLVVSFIFCLHYLFTTLIRISSTIFAKK